jgi:acyl-coenzyme A synthetase/AMP-(fatty) acid ligase
MVVTMFTEVKIMAQLLKGITISGHYPLGHVSGSLSLLGWISLGATIVLSGEHNEDFILKSIEKYRIIYLPLFPNFVRKLIEGEFVDKYDLSSVKEMSTSGAPVPEYVVGEIFNKYKVQFREGTDISCEKAIECIMSIKV